MKTPELELARKSLRCLYVAVDESIAADVQRNVEAAIKPLEAIAEAAERLVRCKGRYHSEQNMIALAALFGVRLPPTEVPKPDECKTCNGMGMIDGLGEQCRACQGTGDAQPEVQP